MVTKKNQNWSRSATDDLWNTQFTDRFVISKHAMERYYGRLSWRGVTIDDICYVLYWGDFVGIDRKQNSDTPQTSDPVEFYLPQDRCLDRHDRARWRRLRHVRVRVDLFAGLIYTMIYRDSTDRIATSNRVGTNENPDRCREAKTKPRRWYRAERRILLARQAAIAA